MALEISYFTGPGESKQTDKIYGTLTGSASVTLTGSSASCGTVPANTNLARLKAGEACRVSNNGAAASASNGVYLAAGDIIELSVSTGSTLLALTA